MAASHADDLVNSVHLWRQNGDGNEEMYRHFDDEARRIAVNIAKLPMVPKQILKDIPRPPNSASRDD